jgi:hypothetical protein
VFKKLAENRARSVDGSPISQPVGLSESPCQLRGSIFQHRLSEDDRTDYTDRGGDAIREKSARERIFEALSAHPQRINRRLRRTSCVYVIIPVLGQPKGFAQCLGGTLQESHIVSASVDRQDKQGFNTENRGGPPRPRRSYCNMALRGLFDRTSARHAQNPYCSVTLP